MTATLATADVTGPLPTGTSVLEASAGTGKTWTIAALVTRYVAEGHARVDELLVVTFGRAATSDLRLRVRERLISVHRELGGASDDPVVQLLNTGDVPTYRQRLATALAAFDSATVTTTHSFCDQVLRSLGLLADLDPGTVLVESLDEVLVEVVDDVFIQMMTERGALPFTRKTALLIARKALADPQAQVLPMGADPEGEPGLRVAFVARVIAEVEVRKRWLRVLGFDDLLSRVRDALMDPVSGPAACQRLRDRFRVVLVDEFQDTDPVQWDVLHSAFHEHRTLVVIGDPKQAIYGFRGADVAAYLKAKRFAGLNQTLGTNWRSDPRVLEGLGALLRGAALGDSQIVVGPVSAGHTVAALGPATDSTPVRVRVVRRAHFGGDRRPAVDGAREVAARDCASQAAHALGEQLTLTPRGSADSRPLEARDIAVLVRTGAQARAVREALLDVGIPSVVSIQESVFGSEAAADWVLLLEALEQPHRKGRVRRLALSAFVGTRAAELADEGSELAVDELSHQLRGWADVLATRGVAGLFATVSEQTRLAERLLGVAGGERVLTDLRHVSEIVHGHALEAELGLSGLVAWLRRQAEDADNSQQERSRRLDSERSAVQILTVHTSKGLEFPVVLVPFGWDTSGGGSSERYPRGHDDADARTLHLGGKSDAVGYALACAGEDRETEAEDLRLLYVAMTRAVSRLVLWWVPSTKTKGGSLPRLLLSPDPADIKSSVTLPDDDVLIAQLQSLAGPCVSVKSIDVVSLLPRDLPAPDAQPLAVALFERPLDTAWRRTSYSGLTRDAHAGVGSEPAAEVKEDEGEVAAEAAPVGDVVPWSELRGSASFGTMVHRMLEHADWSARPLTEELVRVSEGAPSEVLVSGLALAMATPLGRFGIALEDVATRDVLKELDFELPLAGGDSPVGRPLLSSLAGLLRTHLSEGDPMLAYADRLPLLGEQVLRGYLGGSIDAVLRIDGKYVVADHKTNRLARHDVPLTTWHYRKEALDAAMLDAHYPLQALLYTVALHRYLRWRQPGYDPDTHLGGVLYLFLRGMVGTDTGVWSWEPPSSLVLATSDLLAGKS